MAADLSPKQAEVLTFIRRFLQSAGMPPTRGEIAEGLGLRNRQGIDQHLRALESKGALALTAGISRGIRLREEFAERAGSKARPEGRATQGTRPGESHGRPAQDAGTTGLPLLGRIAAGTPILATGNIEDHVHVDAALFRPRASFLLRVRGDSMKDADIHDRDLLAVHQTTQVRNGQIVVARIGDEATVKYYRREGQVVWLDPANAAYRPLQVDLRTQDLAIEGLAVGVIRTGLTQRRR